MEKTSQNHQKQQGVQHKRKTNVSENLWSLLGCHGYASKPLPYPNDYRRVVGALPKRYLGWLKNPIKVIIKNTKHLPSQKTKSLYGLVTTFRHLTRTEQHPPDLACWVGASSTLWHRGPRWVVPTTLLMCWLAMQCPRVYFVLFNVFILVYFFVCL